MPPAASYLGNPNELDVIASRSAVAPPSSYISKCQFILPTGVSIEVNNKLGYIRVRSFKSNCKPLRRISMFLNHQPQQHRVGSAHSAGLTGNGLVTSTVRILVNRFRQRFGCLRPPWPCCILTSTLLGLCRLFYRSTTFSLSYLIVHGQVKTSRLGGKDCVAGLSRSMATVA